MGIAPTGNHIHVTTLGIWRVQDGKISEACLVFDALGMLQQLGVASSSERGRLHRVAGTSCRPTGSSGSRHCPWLVHCKHLVSSALELVRDFADSRCVTAIS
jgi:hypothetical protein